METNRRTFLLNTAKTGIVVLSMPLLTSCGGITRHKLRDETNVTELHDAIGKEGVEILRLASLAPNGHNTQPWTVKILDRTHWIIGTEPTRWLPAVDPGNREMLLSIGAFLENLIIAAEYFGYVVTLDIVARSTKDTELLHVTFSKGTQKTGTLDTILTRRTVRNGLSTQEILSEDLKWITSADAERFSYFPANSPQGKHLTEGTLEANRIQAYRDPAQEELAEWIRWSNEEARQRRDGLTPASMDITGFAGWYVRTFYDRSDVLSKSFREATIKKVAEQMHSCGGWLVMTSGNFPPAESGASQQHGQVDSITAASKNISVPAILETGRSFQRMFLKVRERMIGIHPMTQMLEETQNIHQIAHELGLSDPVQFIVRIGYLKSYPAPVSLRRPVSWFTRL